MCSKSQSLRGLILSFYDRSQRTDHETDHLDHIENIYPVFRVVVWFRVVQIPTGKRERRVG